MRIVVKVGTSTLAYATGRLNIQRVERMCRVLSDLKNAGHEIILVSSGAIAMGFGKLNLRERPHDMPTKQASAAVGQCELMYVYDKLFTEYNHTVAQLLITAPDIADSELVPAESAARPTRHKHGKRTYVIGGLELCEDPAELTVDGTPVKLVFRDGADEEE